MVLLQVNKIEELEVILKKIIRNSTSISKKKYPFYDAKLSPSALNINFYSEINSLSPFGSGNPEPRFVIEDLELIKSSIVGDRHIKLFLVLRMDLLLRV